MFVRTLQRQTPIAASPIAASTITTGTSNVTVFQVLSSECSIEIQIPKC